MNVLITGANGFIGSALVQSLLTKNYVVTALSRKVEGSVIGNNFQHIKIDNLLNLNNKDTSCFSEAEKSLINQDVVIHTAARVHIMEETEQNPLSAFLAMNTKATLDLATLAAKSGVKRFIFMSTINVYGAISQKGKPYKHDDEVSPITSYAKSKYEAEQGLMDISKNTGMEVVIIRSPLVYGAGVPANFNSLLKLVSKKWPLPFRTITENKRSFIGLDNLIDLIIVCIKHEKAGNKIFLVSDNNDLSCRDLFENLCSAFGYKAKLLPFPLVLFNLLGKLTGKQNTINSLCSSFQADISYTCNTLGWMPSVSVEREMKKTVLAFKELN